MITMGSLFSGFGGFEVAAEKHNIKVLWQSEIEPWASELLKKRFPKVKQLGDVNNINGAEIEPVEIITFGSPCQDMSLAGRREGLDGAKSSLFYEAIRIIREMRCATNGKYPKFAIWENVPGAFSSNQGNDFRTVLEEITESKIPIPKSGKWAKSGMVRGRAADVAWRVLDAQYWGIPQRRKRIYLVADYRDRRSAEILFKPESLSGNLAKSCESTERVAADFEAGIRTTVGHRPLIALESHPNDSRIRIDSSGNIQTLTQRMGTGGGNVPLVMLPIYAIDRAAYNQGQNALYNISISDSGISQTVVAKGPGAVALPVVAFQGQASESAELSISDRISPTVQVAKQVDCCTYDRTDYVVRKLTPRECAKLQGFPADWHENVVNDKGRTLPDSAAYKGYGNAVATVCAEYVLDKVAEELLNERSETMNYIDFLKRQRR